jgi:hypothetical protein
MKYGRRVIPVKDVRASWRRAFGQDAGSMRNVMSRGLILASLAVLATVTASCCKQTPPAVTPAAVPAATEQVTAAQSAPPAPVAGATGGTGGTGGAAERQRPATKEACAACQGKWGRHGLADAESCLCRTKDGGRPCLDGAECQGQCVARDGDFVVVQKGPPPRGHYKGKCSEFDTTFGCHRFVPAGARKRGPLPAEEAADQLCYD